MPSKETGEKKDGSQIGEIFSDLVDLSNDILDEEVEVHVSNRIFINRLLEIVTEPYSYSEIFESPSEIPDQLKGTNYGAEGSYRPILEKQEYLDFCGFLGLMVYYIRIDDSEAAISLYESAGSEFSEKYPNYDDFLESYIAHKAHQPGQGDIESAVEGAISAVDSCPDHYLIYLNAAEAIIEKFEYHPHADPIISNSDINEELEQADLEDAVMFSRKAVERSTDYDRAYYIKARAELLESNFKEARNALREAYRLDQDPTQESFVDRSKLRRIKQYLVLRRSLHDAENKITELNKDVEEATGDITSVKEDLNSSFDKLRSNNLQFIGFFAAIITLSVTTTKLVTGSNRTFAMDAGLVTILTGGLLIGFSGFGLLLPDTNDEADFPSKQALVMGGGLLLIVLGWIPALL